MVQKFPQRLPLDRDARLRPLAAAPGGAAHRVLDLFGGLRRVPAVVDAYIDGAVALGAQTRRESGPQDGGLAETRLAEQHREELALHPARELGDLLVAPVEISPRLFRERRQSQPGIALVHRIGGRIGGRHALWLRVHCERARMKSTRRCANSGSTCPPGRCVKCSALNLSGASASAAVVASMLTGRMNSAPSAMLRTRSMA